MDILPFRCKWFSFLYMFLIIYLIKIYQDNPESAVILIRGKLYLITKKIEPPRETDIEPA